MKSLRMLLAMMEAATAQTPAPTADELRQFEEKARRVHVSELGDMMFRARTREHARLAERVLSERLAAGDLDAHEPKETDHA